MVESSATRGRGQSCRQRNSAAAGRLDWELGVVRLFGYSGTSEQNWPPSRESLRISRDPRDRAANDRSRDGKRA